MNSQNTIVSLPDEILDIVQNPIFRETFFRIFKKIKRKSTPPLQEAAYKAFFKVLEWKDIEPWEFFTLYNLFSGDTDVISHVFESLEKTNRTQEVIPSNFEDSVRADLHLLSWFHRNFFETHVRLILEGKITESSLTPLWRIGSYSFSKVTELESLSDTQYVMQDASGNIIYWFEIYSQTYGQNWETFEKDIQTGKWDWKILYEESNDDKIHTHILNQETWEIGLSIDGYKVHDLFSWWTHFGISIDKIDTEHVWFTLYDIVNLESLETLKFSTKIDIAPKDIYSSGKEILFIYDTYIDGIWQTHIYSISRKKEIYKDISSVRKVEEIEASNGKEFIFIFNTQTKSYELFDVETWSFVFWEDAYNADFFTESYTGLIVIDWKWNEIVFDNTISFNIKKIISKPSDTGYTEFYLEMKDGTKNTLVIMEKFERFVSFIITHPSFHKIIDTWLLWINKKHLPEWYTTKQAKQLLKAFMNGDFWVNDFPWLYTLLGHIPLIVILSHKFQKSLLNHNDVFWLKVRTFFSSDTSEEKLSEELRFYLLSKYKHLSAKNGTFFDNFESEWESQGYKIFWVKWVSNVYIWFGPTGTQCREILEYITPKSKTFIIEDGANIVVLQNAGQWLELVEKIEWTLWNIFSNEMGCNLEIYNSENEIVMYDVLKRRTIAEIEFGDISWIESLENGYLVYFLNEKWRWWFVFISDEGNGKDSPKSEECLVDALYTTYSWDILLLWNNEEKKTIIVSKKYGTILYNEVDFIDFSRNAVGRVVMKWSYIDPKQSPFTIEIKDIKSSIDQPSR